MLRIVRERAAGLLSDLLETSYARGVAATLGVPSAIGGQVPMGARDNPTTERRLLLVEGLLRETVGTVRVPALRPDDWLATHDDSENTIIVWVLWFWRDSPGDGR